MKKILLAFIAFMLVFCFCALPVAAKSKAESGEQSEQSAVSDSETSAEESQQIVIPPHPNKKYTPVYITVGILGAVGVAAAAVVVSKKMK